MSFGASGKITDEPRLAHLGTTTKARGNGAACVCGAPAAAARRGHAFWDHSATLGIRTCCGWSFGHSRGPVVVSRYALVAGPVVPENSAVARGRIAATLTPDFMDERILRNVAAALGLEKYRRHIFLCA